ARDAFAVVLELGVVALALAHRADLLGPAEDLLVESLGLVDPASAELGTRVGSRFAYHLGAEHVLRLPGGDEGSGRVLKDGHAARIQNVERRGDDLAACGLDLL